MNILLLKLLLTPMLIGAISLAGRRWGSGVSGWLVGLPLTSGPVVFFLALAQGASFAATAATGILAGVFSVACFCLVYSWLALRWGWPLTLFTGWLIFAASTWGLEHVTMPIIPLYIGIIAVLALVLWLLPGTSQQSIKTTPSWWDIPARMLFATVFVLCLTEFAPHLGPQLSGLLAPFPIFATILAAFTHHFQGGAAATPLLRGVLLGLFAFASFFLIVALLIVPAGLGVAFLCASVAALSVQGFSLLILQRSRKLHISQVSHEA
jgi:hypothetical protein